jgi:hypothetical protein
MILYAKAHVQLDANGCWYVAGMTMCPTPSEGRVEGRKSQRRSRTWKAAKGRFRTFGFDTPTVGWHQEPTTTLHSQDTYCIILKSVGTELADQMTDDHDAMGLEAMCKPDPVIGWAIPRVSQLVRAIQRAEPRSTHLAAAQFYPVAARGCGGSLRHAVTLVR